MKTTTSQTDWIPFNAVYTPGLTHYKIEFDDSDKDFRFQRHLWKNIDGSIETEDWMRVNK